MVQFTTIIRKFDRHAEKTGWTYIIVPAKWSEKIKAGWKASYRVKGRIDNYVLEKTSILPSGEGDFILPLNKKMRDAIRKPVGSEVLVKMEADDRQIEIDADLIRCLQEEPVAQQRFNSLPPSHQRYYSKWITEAKTENTRAKRIAASIKALLQNRTFGEAVRAAASDRIDQ